MKRLLSVLAIAALVSCSNDDTTPSLYETNGFVVTSVNETTTGYSYYAGYFNQLDGTANIDLTAESTYGLTRMYDSKGEYMYGNSLDGENFVAKLAVSKDGKIVEVAKFPVLNFLRNIELISDQLAVYTLWGPSPTIGMFNPETMETLGTIDLTNATKIAGNERNYYNTLIYRPQDNKLFATLITDDQETSQFYDDTKIYVEVINMTTKTWEKTAIFNGAMDPYTAGSENGIIDESGNIFIYTAGSYGLDGKMGASAPAASRPKVLKIPAGTTDFDASYAFNPVDEFGMNNLLVQLMMGGIYGENGVAFTAISAAPESDRILELVMKFAMGTITEDEYYELRLAVFYSQNQRWVKLDLNAQTVTAIEGIPLTAAYAYPMTYKYDGKYYFQFNATNDGTSGYYEYDLSSNTATKVINITKGGFATDLIKLGAN